MTVDEFIENYFKDYEWVGAGKSGIRGAEWIIVLDIKALRARLLELVEDYRD